jgi:hypothetical protein
VKTHLLFAGGEGMRKESENTISLGPSKLITGKFAIVAFTTMRIASLATIAVVALETREIRDAIIWVARRHGL